MTHKQCKERNRLLKEKYTAGTSIPDLAATFGMPQEYVRQIIRPGRIGSRNTEWIERILADLAGDPAKIKEVATKYDAAYNRIYGIFYRRYGRTTKKVDWDSIDWRLSDSTLAIALGLSRQAVNFQRSSRGATKSELPQHKVEVIPKLIAAKQMLAAGEPIKTVAAKVGLAYSTVWKLKKDLDSVTKAKDSVTYA